MLRGSCKQCMLNIVVYAFPYFLKMLTVKMYLKNFMIENIVLNVTGLKVVVYL